MTNLALDEFVEQRKSSVRWALHPNHEEYELRKKEIRKKNLPQYQEDLEIKNLIDEMGI